jgi:hypothetical protein
MNHSYRVERICIGHCDGAGDASPLTEKAAVRAFATLAMGVEQLLGSMPHSVSAVATRYTQDGLDIRVDSPRDGTAVRNMVASVVSDFNLASPGLNLSLISRPAAVPKPAPASVFAVRATQAAAAAEDAFAPPPHTMVAASQSAADSEGLRLAA